MKRLDRPQAPQAEAALDPLAGHTLDPADWSELRAQGHAMLDDMFDYLETLRERPVWQPIPEAVRARFRGPLPREPAALPEVHQQFMLSLIHI